MRRYLPILLALPFAALANVPDADRGSPGAQPPTLSAQPPGSGTRNPEPGARNPQPATKNEEPRTKNQEPETKNEEPGTKNQEPRTKNSSWSPQPFSHYQPILDRKPFGVPPPAPVGPAAAEAAPPPPPPFVSKIALCAINRTPAGSLAVGFVDGSQNPARSYYIDKGETQDGFTVVSVDFDSELAVLEKDGVRVDLKMGKGPTVSGAAKPPPAAAPSAAMQPPAAAPAVPAPEQPKPGRIFRPSHAGIPPVPGVSAVELAEQKRTHEELVKIRESGGDVASYLTKLRERRAKENEAKAATEKAAREKLQELANQMTAAELAKREHQINLQLVEQGARPISELVLTPEEEKDLVQKGILP